MAPSDFSCTCGILVYEDDNDDTGRLTPLKEDFLVELKTSHRAGPHGETPGLIRWLKEVRGEDWPRGFIVFHGEGKAGQEKLLRIR